MNVVMIYFYSKRFRFAPSFNNVKSTVKISSIFVAFLENMNFIYLALKDVQKWQWKLGHKNRTGVLCIMLKWKL